MLFDRMLDGVQTRSNIIKQGGQTVKCSITEQFLMFGVKNFPFGQGFIAVAQII